MIYLLDTNIVSYWMRGDEAVMAGLRQHKPSDLAISTITLAEIGFGIEKSPVKKRERKDKIERISSLLTILPFDEPAAQQYAPIRARLEIKGLSISERDLLIASVAMANGLIVVTHNVGEFKRIEKLRVEDGTV